MTGTEQQGRLFESHLCRGQIKLKHTNAWIDVLVDLAQPLPTPVIERFALEDSLLRHLQEHGYDVAFGPVLFHASDEWIERHRNTVPLIEGSKLQKEQLDLLPSV